MFNSAICAADEIDLKTTSDDLEFDVVVSDPPCLEFTCVFLQESKKFAQYWQFFECFGIFLETFLRGQESFCEADDISGLSLATHTLMPSIRTQLNKTHMTH